MKINNVITRRKQKTQDKQKFKIDNNFLPNTEQESPQLSSIKSPPQKSTQPSTNTMNFHNITIIPKTPIEQLQQQSDENIAFLSLSLSLPLTS